MRRRVLLPALVSLSAVLSCGTEPSDVFGNWVATTFVVTPTGQAAIDLIPIGGTLAINIDEDNFTTGQLNVPAVAGQPAFQADMAGSAIVTETAVVFQQSADTFVRDLTWTRGTMVLTVTNQSVGGASYTITLTRL